MGAAGTTGELYKEADNPSSVLGAPPSAPAPVPEPTRIVVEKPVTTKSRMADEKPDGTIRDTSTEALRPSNDLNFRNISDEEIKKPAETKPEEKPIETKPAEPVKEASPVPEKIYAGKFKSPEDLEKSYQELERKLTETATAKANLEREKLATPVAPVVKTPEQTAAEQAEANKIVTDFVTNPKEFVGRIKEQSKQETLTALTAQQIRNEWVTNNPDIAEHEIRVAFEATQLIQSDPELARNPAALLTKATDNFRAFTGKIRTAGAKEALTQETRTIPLLQPSSTTQATEQPAKAPLTADQAHDAHIRFLKEQEQRSHRGLRR